VPAGATGDHFVEVTFDGGPLVGRQTARRVVPVASR